MCIIENDKKVVTLINPVTGEWYQSTDMHCPIFEVGCIFNGENVSLSLFIKLFFVEEDSTNIMTVQIWANIQQYGDPQRLWWGLNDIKSWKPFFTKEFPRPQTLASIQTNSLNYVPVKDVALQTLEKEIERALVKSIEEWRGRFATRWNRYGSFNLFKSNLL